MGKPPILPYLAPEMESRIVMALTALEKIRTKTNTSIIARRLDLSRVQTWRYLQIMEQRGIVKRVGVKGGWKLTLRSRYDQQ